MIKEKEKEIDIEESFHTIDEIDADSVAVKDAEEPTEKNSRKKCYYQRMGIQKFE
jgi:hypothetical protein